MPSIIMLSVVMVNVVMLGVAMLGVVILSAIMLNVIIINVVAPYSHHNSYFYFHSSFETLVISSIFTHTRFHLPDPLELLQMSPALPEPAHFHFTSTSFPHLTD